jgi:hypothetical protein
LPKTKHLLPQRLIRSSQALPVVDSKVLPLVSASSVCADNFNKFKQYLLQHNATLAFASGTLSLSFLSSSPSFSTSVSSLSSGHSPITQLAAALKIVFQSVSGCLTY